MTFEEWLRTKPGLQAALKNVGNRNPNVVTQNAIEVWLEAAFDAGKAEGLKVQ